MYTKLINLALLICLASHVNSQECVTYNFEEEFDEFFTNERICDDNNAPWSRGFYEDLAIESPNPLSKTFMKPGETLSCTSSDTFPVRAGGIFEVKAYMESASENDQIIVTVQGLQEEGEDASLGFGILSAQVEAESDNGFYNFRVTWQVPDEKLYNGYVVFRGVASEQSTVFVDSFRYIPPDVDSESCTAYEDETTPDGPETDGATTDDPGTGGSTTDDPGIGGSTTDDPELGGTTTNGTEIDGTTTDDPDTDGPGTDGPGGPSTESSDTGVDPIWKTLAIVFATILSVTIIGLVCWSFYECGKRKALKETPQELFMTNHDNLPNPITVPRVNKVYSDSVYYKNP